MNGVGICIGTYVATVPNRNSPPAIRFRESYRENGKVNTRTLAFTASQKQADRPHVYVRDLDSSASPPFTHMAEAAIPSGPQPAGLCFAPPMPHPD